MFAQLGLYAMALLTLAACENREEASDQRLREIIQRKHNEYLYDLPPPKKVALAAYPWEEEHPGKHPRITKEFFRCKGSTLNPPRIIHENGETKRYFDCAGADSHSLPLKEGKEFIYPILISLLNEVQKKTGKKVIITSGHRCPEHNAYVDPSKPNQFSKHQLGAEVSFYVRGLESQPENIVAVLLEYYQETPKYDGLSDYRAFKRWDKPTDVSIQPWYNTEIFIKLYKKEEGRNFDNRHPYPYLSVQVRYDLDAREKVHYSWDKAFRNYMRS